MTWNSTCPCCLYGTQVLISTVSVIEIMETVRKRHPNYIPCRFSLPNQTELKLLVPVDATVGYAMHAARQRMNMGTAGTGYFMMCRGRMCVGTTPLKHLDDNAPEEVQFKVVAEDTFG